MEWSIYNHLYFSDVANTYLLYSALSNTFLRVSLEGYQILCKLRDNPECKDVPNEYVDMLKEKRFIVESNETEINKIVLNTLRRRFNTQSLSLTLAPTQACNFACPYCYENYRHGKKMSQAVQDGIVNFVINNGIKSLAVNWYGGEPTLAIDVIKNLTNRFKEAVNNYSAYMVTNGYKLDELVDYIEQLSIHSIQVTLDGTERSHDRTRHLKNGGKTFSKILKNLDIIAEENINVDVSIRMNISKDNANEYVSLQSFLANRYNGKRIHLYPAFVTDYTNCKSSCYEDSVSKGLFLKNMFYENGIITKELYPRVINKGCMAQTMNAFVVGPDGKLYKCWHHLGDESMAVGSILDPNLISNFSLLADVMIYKRDPVFNQECQKCVLFPSCDGGCYDNKRLGKDFCIPAKSMLSDFLDIKYLQWLSVENNCSS